MAGFLSQVSATAVFPIATNPGVLDMAGGVTFDGTNYVVGLFSEGAVAGQRLNLSGEMVGTPVVVGACPVFPPAVALAGGARESLAAWSDVSLSPGVTLRGQRFSPSGGPVGGAFPLLASVGSHGPQEVLAAASDGTNYLVLWRDTTHGGAYAQRVTGSGTLAGGETLVAAVSGESGNRNFAVVFGRTNYLVAWQTGSNNQNHVYGALVSAGGAVGSVFAINQTASLAQNPIAAAFDGTNFFVVWSRCTELTPQGQPVWKLCGRQVSPGGSPLGSERVLVDESATFPALAFDGTSYLLVWGYESATTSSNITVHARYVGPDGRAQGGIFSPLPRQGGYPPLLPLNGLCYDGTRFLLAATYGAFVLDAQGEITGFSGGDVYGAFIPRSSAPPVFTNVGLANGVLKGELIMVPGLTYTVETSTNLVDWEGVGVVGAGETNRLYFEEAADIMLMPHLFYRVALGVTMPPSFSGFFMHFAQAGGFGSALTPTISYPVTLQGYVITFEVRDDVLFPEAATVQFTGPSGSGVVGVQANAMQTRVEDREATYYSPMIASAQGAPGGPWTVNYAGTNVVLNLPDPQAAARLVVPVPTVNVSGGVLQSVSWVYHNAATGAALSGPPLHLTGLQVQVEGLVGGRLYNSPTLQPGATTHSLNASVSWSNVGAVNMAYDDDLGNHYVVTFHKP